MATRKIKSLFDMKDNEHRFCYSIIKQAITDYTRLDLAPKLELSTTNKRWRNRQITLQALSKKDKKSAENFLTRINIFAEACGVRSEAITYALRSCGIQINEFNAEGEA